VSARSSNLCETKSRADEVDPRVPYQIGYDAAGVVTDVGEDVKGLSVGDQVYTRLPEASRGNPNSFLSAPMPLIAVMVASNATRTGN
jgi:NADPH:quinone reductase-like Zn-dependent oxidoreductase